MRQILLGTDEAGYGPNLGPLVVSLTAWETPAEDISFLLEPLKNAGISIGDSKKIYHGGSLASLETGVLVPLRTLKKGECSTQVGEFASNNLWFNKLRCFFSHKGTKDTEEFGEPLDSSVNSVPPCEKNSYFHGTVSKKDVLPTANAEEKIARLTTKFETILQQHQVRLLDMQYRSVEAEEFNKLLDHFDSKGTLLSHVTLRLIADQIEKLAQAKNSLPVLVLCDKHGGRNHYLDLLTEFFPGKFIHVIKQSRESSVYRLTTDKEPGTQRSAVPGQTIEVRFLAKGESHLPIALASMLSKYQRELAMVQFNAFWQTHVPDLQPTAGYPEDAKRFKEQIAGVQKKLGIVDECFWRKR